MIGMKREIKTIGDVILELAAIERDIEAVNDTIYHLVEDYSKSRTLRLALENIASRLEEVIKFLKEGNVDTKTDR